VISNSDRMGLRWRPFAFTEQGIAMLSSVLRSERAIRVNIIIMRAFVRMRRLLSTHKEILAKLNELEYKTGENRADIQLIFETIYCADKKRAAKCGPLSMLSMYVGNLCNKP
jgi:hypothetical protein